MDNNESPLIKEGIFSIQNELFQKAEHNVYLASPSIGAKDRLVREKLNNYDVAYITISIGSITSDSTDYLGIGIGTLKQINNTGGRDSYYV